MRVPGGLHCTVIAGVLPKNLVWGDCWCLLSLLLRLTKKKEAISEWHLKFQLSKIPHLEIICSDLVKNKGLMWTTRLNIKGQILHCAALVSVFCLHVWIINFFWQHRSWYATSDTGLPCCFLCHKWWQFPETVTSSSERLCNIHLIAFHVFRYNLQFENVEKWVSWHELPVFCSKGNYWEQKSFSFKIQQKQSLTVWQKQAAPNLPVIQHVFLNSNWVVD